MPKFMRVDGCLIHPGSDVCLVLGLPEGQQLLEELLRSLYNRSRTCQSCHPVKISAGSNQAAALTA